MITIRNAGLEDIALIVSMAQQVWEPTYRHILSAEQLSYMFEMMYSPDALNRQMQNGQQFLIAQDDDRAYGFSSFELKDSGQTIKIHKLYVLPSAQGKGLGHLLLADIEKRGNAFGGVKISLNVNRFNKAYDFYIKEGFYKAGEEDIEIGRGYLMEDYIMEKRLI